MNGGGGDEMEGVGGMFFVSFWENKEAEYSLF